MFFFLKRIQLECRHILFTAHVLDLSICVIASQPSDVVIGSLPYGLLFGVFGAASCMYLKCWHWLGAIMNTWQR